MGLANARFYAAEHFFWDERADTLEDQVLMPILDPRLRGPGGQPQALNSSNADKDALEAFLLTLTDDTLLDEPRWSDPFNQRPASTHYPSIHS